ncbi:MAG: MAPEG family protein [Myxococcales bacterium]|nr:MAPEG family protein [Myxococcales bacterium]MCB9521612.1 MAPEG family protein [Myxococcales bacterium]MCB9532418.1 MAPEG family protein [Myxococcales bacterium]
MNAFALYAGAGVLLLTLLALNVSRVRIAERVANGDGGSRALKKAIRAHMNSVEHLVPFGLVVAGLGQVGADTRLVTALAAAMLAARVGHAASMLGSRFQVRRWAAGLTYVVEVVGCVWLLVEAVRG